MEGIVSALAAADGVACFTRLYLAVTKGMQDRLASVTFADPPFVSRLDVDFANLFFAALESSQRDAGSVPAAWAPLFEARSRKGIAPLQFALAGMNAHINRDLPVALVATWQQAGVRPDDDSPQHADYLLVNRLLAAVEAEVKPQYLGGRLRHLDRLVHRFDRIDDVVAMWDVARARDAAWTNARMLWLVRSDEDLYAATLDTLDHTVGFAGRGLLIPADTLLQKLGRLIG